MDSLPKRKPNRLAGYDYSQSGCYFVTICTKDREHLFGCVVGADVLIGPAGGCVHPPLRLIARAALVVCCDSPGPPPGHTARCAPPLPGPPPKPSGDGRGFGGERSRSGRSELCRLRRSEGSGACGDAVTVRLFATPGFPPPRAGLRAARAALRSPSLRSIRAAHNGSPLLFYPISGQKERGVIPLVLFGLFTSPRR